MRLCREGEAGRSALQVDRRVTAESQVRRGGLKRAREVLYGKVMPAGRRNQGELPGRGELFAIFRVRQRSGRAWRFDGVKLEPPGRVEVSPVCPAHRAGSGSSFDTEASAVAVKDILDEYSSAKHDPVGEVPHPAVDDLGNPQLPAALQNLLYPSGINPSTRAFVIMLSAHME